MALTKTPIELSSTPSIVDGGNATAITIDSSENVGIGTSSPSQKLHVYESSTSSQAYVTVQNNRSRNAAVLTQTTNGGFYTGTSIGTDSLCWQVYDASAGERMRIDSSGTVKISHADTASEGLRVIQTTAARTSGGALGLFYDDQAGTTQPTLVAQQNGTGDILQLFDGGSQVVTVQDGGNLLVGGTSAGTVSGNNAMITVRRDSGNCGISYQSGTAATDQWETYSNLSAQFHVENTSTSNGAYLQYNSGAGWVNFSDERWKTNWTSLEDSSSKIAALNVGKYHMLNKRKEIIESAKWDYGVKAQELLLVIPDAVDVPENPEDKYGVVSNIVFWHAVKAIQEQQATIEALTQRIETLENT